MRTRSIRLVASALAVCISLPIEARSANAEARSASPQAKAEFAAAKRAYELGQFEQALAGYTDAYQRKSHPAILFNIAQCHRQLGNYERAAFFYRRYLALSVTRPKNAGVVEELIAEVESRKAALEQKAAAEVEEAKRLELARLDAEKAQAARREAEAEARREEESRRQRELELARTSELARINETSKTASTNSAFYKQWWFWTGVGVVAVGAAAVTYGVNQPKPTTLGTIDVR